MSYASPDDLLRAVTGDGIDPAPFLDYLTAKYGALYGPSQLSCIIRRGDGRARVSMR